MYILIAVRLSEVGLCAALGLTETDLCLVRQVLQHLSNDEIMNTANVRNFSRYDFRRCSNSSEVAES